ncbi:hypothetical protein MSAN_00181400 [Mycena sanguinolenta]|uniref:Uncharacterized protein n=1 Tax=Mycena sanguinolenta TaxID=230812 RepID=A0A8H6ZHP3_9AGAR|nr:hypothetical protein MSAN_00181400 [Mycena sanguinolenta]
MRFTLLFSAICFLASGVFAAVPNIPEDLKAVSSLTQQNCYGAPIPPWLPGAYPGWYYGQPDCAPSGLTCIVGVVENLLCQLLGLLCPMPPPPSPPPPPVGSPPPKVPLPDGYSWAYQNYTCATEVWPISGYITFGEVQNVPGCANMCDGQSECVFANCYHDNNAGAGKNFTTLFTCSMFRVVTTIANATNCGKQDQKNGGLTYITDSYGLINTKRAAAAPH